MIEKINLNNILFLDIETVPEAEDFNSLDPEMKELWEHKTQYQRKDEYTPEDFYDRAGIWAEFGKIVCISVGYCDNFLRMSVIGWFKSISTAGSK